MACLIPHGPETALGKPVDGFMERPLMRLHRGRTGFLFSRRRVSFLKQEGSSDA